MQSLSTKYRLHIDLNINLLPYLHIFSFGEYVQMELQLMAFSYVAVAAKATNSEDSRHSESASD